MSTHYSIEKAILVSILEHHFVHSDPEIMKVQLHPEYFTHPIHKLFVKAINRLKELGEPVNSDFMREKFLSNHKWDTLYHEVQLLEIMVHNPIGTLSMFEQYLKLLEEKYMMGVAV